MNVKSNVFFIVILSLAVSLFLTQPIFSYIAQNGSGQGYTEGSGSSGEKAAVKSANIEMYVMQGGGYFLKAHAAVQEMLNRVEWQDIKAVNYDELNRLVGSALYNVTIARVYYWQLVALAEVTPYNPEVIEKLKSFDYDAFLKENNLNRAVFDRVRGYLAKGDITGGFKYFLGNLMAMEQMLGNVQNELLIRRMPDLTLSWKLNELCAENTLFGSYAARIFHAL